MIEEFKYLPAGSLITGFCPGNSPGKKDFISFFYLAENFLYFRVKQGYTV